jgi:hypothetical protein
MNFANAIEPKTSRQSTTNMTMPFVGVGKFSGNQAIKSMFANLQERRRFGFRSGHTSRRQGFEVRQTITRKAASA